MLPLETKYAYHEDGTSPENGEVFVFGSNEAGIHGAGAAKAALDKFGAILGQGFGWAGNSFAIPTKDVNIKTLPLETIEKYVYVFLTIARNNESCYFMTRIGCGLAGYNDSDIAPMFKDASNNINFPIEWKEYLEDATE